MTGALINEMPIRRLRKWGPCDRHRCSITAKSCWFHCQAVNFKSRNLHRLSGDETVRCGSKIVRAKLRNGGLADVVTAADLVPIDAAPIIMTRQRSGATILARNIDHGLRSCPRSIWPLRRKGHP